MNTAAHANTPMVTTTAMEAAAMAPAVMPTSLDSCWLVALMPMSGIEPGAYATAVMLPWMLYCILTSARAASGAAMSD